MVCRTAEEVMVRCFAALGVIISLVAALCSDPALAQGDFPTRPVKLVVPYPGGGSNDVLARIVAE
jgi:tripartite-type tricarboxylate transporter receptor subunit TctC